MKVKDTENYRVLFSPKFCQRNLICVAGGLRVFNADEGGGLRLKFSFFSSRCLLGAAFPL